MKLEIRTHVMLCMTWQFLCIALFLESYIPAKLLRRLTFHFSKNCDQPSHSTNIKFRKSA